MRLPQARPSATKARCLPWREIGARDLDLMLPEGALLPGRGARGGRSNPTDGFDVSPALLFRSGQVLGEAVSKTAWKHELATGHFSTMSQRHANACVTGVCSSSGHRFLPPLRQIDVRCRECGRALVPSRAPLVLPALPVNFCCALQ